MDCPICGSDDLEIINSKQKSSKKKVTEEYLLKCEDCGHVFKDIISLKKPIAYRLIISEQDKSHKTTIELSPRSIGTYSYLSVWVLRSTPHFSLPTAIINWSIIPHFMPIKSFSAFMETLAISIMLILTSYISLRKYAVNTSIEADEDNPEELGILPL